MSHVIGLQFPLTITRDPCCSIWLFPFVDLHFVEVREWWVQTISTVLSIYHKTPLLSRLHTHYRQAFNLRFSGRRASPGSVL